MLNKLPEPQSPELPQIADLLMAGVRQNLARQVLSLPDSSVVIQSGSDKMRALQATLPAGSTITWPRALMRLQRVSSGVQDVRHGVNPRAYARRGEYLKVNDTQTSVLKHHFVPAIFEFEVEYLTDSFSDATGFALRWVAAAVRRSMNFTVTYMNIGFDIQCILSDDVSTPPRDASVDVQGVFEYITTLQVAGYLTDRHPDATSQVPLVTKHLNVTMDTIDERDPRTWSEHHRMPVKDPT